MTADERPAPLVAGHPERVHASTGSKQKPLVIGAVLLGLLLTVGTARALRRR